MGVDLIMSMFNCLRQWVLVIGYVGRLQNKRRPSEGLVNSSDRHAFRFEQADKEIFEF